MKKLNSVFLAVIMSFYGITAMTPALVLANNGGNSKKDNHGSEVRTVALSNSDSDSDDDDDDNHGSRVRIVARDNHGQNLRDNDNKNRHEEDEDEDEDEDKNECEDRDDDDEDNNNPPSATTTAPMISGLMASSTGNTSEAILWNTNIPTNSKVYFSATNPVVIGGLETVLVSSPSLLTSHLIGLGGLTANSTYFFIAVSSDSLGNTATSSQSSFTTPPIVLPTFTLAQVATHNVAGNCWTAISGSVYNITSYISSHPGGASPISLLCGTDGTTLFNGQHTGDSNPAAVIASLKIGTLAI